MTIKVIEIENIKGIKKKSFSLDILPNRPSILVAPNGFGKSSFANAFNSLQENGLVLNNRSLHQNDSTNQPRLFIKYQRADNAILDLEANVSRNTIKDEFDCFVINNQIGAKGTGKNYGSEVTINPVVLINSIPERAKFDYSLKRQKESFGLNGKVLQNIKYLFEHLKLIESIDSNYAILDRALENETQQQINRFITELNNQSGNSSVLIGWIESNKIHELSRIDCLIQLVGILEESGLSFDLKAEYFLAAIQIITMYKDGRASFEKACKYKIYEFYKKSYRSTLESFNSTWKDIYIKESKGKLVVEFPSFYHISNGERDILTFVSLLHQAKTNLKKKNSILIIDEIFDYLDDSSLIAVQYHVTQFIEEYKLNGRRIYPLILTHLDPNYFRNFTFSKQKVYYLNKYDFNTNKSLVELIENRDNPLIKEDVSKYLFHYHTSCINKRQEFKQLSLKETWGEGHNFDNFLNKEVLRYFNEADSYDPLVVCCAVRKKIEKLVYEEIISPDDKEKFLEAHKTREKLEFAESIGVTIPEAYYLLGIVYNDALHWRKNQDKKSSIAAKLENSTIKYLIKDILER